MKKVIALAMAGVMTAGMTTVAFADFSETEKIALGYDTVDPVSGSTGQVVYIEDDNGDFKTQVKESDFGATTFEAGAKVYIPVAVLDDKDAGSNPGVSNGDAIREITKDEIKSYKVFTDWKVGDLDVKPTIEYVKYGTTPAYGYAVVVTIPETTDATISDLAGSISIAKTSTEAKEKNAWSTLNFDTSYAASSKGIENNFEGSFTDPTKGAIVKFADNVGEIDIEFDDNFLFTVDATGQGKLNLLYNTKFDKEISDLYPDANLNFLNFEGNPIFNKTGTGYLYADKGSYVYEVKDGKVVALDATYDEDYEAYSFKTRTLGQYIISDVELEEKEIPGDGDNSSSETESSTSSNTSSGTEGNTKPNPDTGR